MQADKFTRKKASVMLPAAVLLTIAAAIINLLSPSNPAQASPATKTAGPSGCQPIWTVIPSQNVGASGNILKDVVYLAPDDIWTVGYYSVGTNQYNTMAQHWDGSQWTVVTTPNPGYSNLINGISAVASNDIWAVGQYNLSPTTGGYHLLTLHWDGTQWNNVPNPDPGFNYTNYLAAVDAVAANDVWTVGFYRHNSPLELIMHWDGSQWNVLNSPQTPIAMLSAVDARTAGDVWAAGGINDNPIFEHYNGTSWSVVADPALANPAYLNGIVATTESDAWAVGAQVIGGVNHTLVERWNGAAWAVVNTPDVGRLYAIDAAADNDIWAAGESSFLHWDGSTWTAVAAPTSGTLYGMDVLSSNSIMAVGAQQVSGTNKTLIERYAPPCGTPTPTLGPTNSPTNTPVTSPTFTPTYTPTPTNTTLVTPSATQATTGTPQATPSNTETPTHSPTPPTGTTSPIATGTPSHTPDVTNTPTGEPATNTPAPPSQTGTPSRTATSSPTSATTATASATASVCSISFTDVPEGSTFYPYVTCLAWMGIINGYPDGTYRPADPVTRGQAAKIIANSAGWSEEIGSTQQTFNDVSPNSTFWIYVERAVLHQAINGYACGSPGEPCPGQYYRPGNTITRGQIAKIAAISANYNDPIPPTQQTFVDVAPNSTFWIYVEQVALHGVINGYVDGTYRPQNTLSRGQIAKIASITFFPSCATR